MAGVYAHWPFCQMKCRYCAFVSVPDLGLMDRYLAAIRAEAERRSGELDGRRVGSVFLGGGTPSVADPEALRRMMAAIRGHFHLAEGAEVSLEANPSSISERKLDAWLSAGANRLSMGLQAAQDRHLAALGRLHTRDMFERAYRMARRAGFSNMSLDLMYGLPSQTMDEWEHSLRYAISLDPEHISGYCLSLEVGTPLFDAVQAGLVPQPDEDLAADMFLKMHDVLEQAGYTHYEISNFARPGRECAHNLKYWTREEYIGLGCAAHSLVRETRSANRGDVRSYMAAIEEGGDPCVEREPVDFAGREEEYLMLRTRLREGFSLAEYESLFGRPFLAAHANGAQTSLREGLCDISAGRLVPTLKGMLFQNRLALHLACA